MCIAVSETVAPPCVAACSGRLSRPPRRAALPSMHSRKEGTVAEHVYHLAFGIEDAEDVSAFSVLTALAKSEGYGKPPEEHDPEDYGYHDGYEPNEDAPGTYLRFDVLPRTDGGDWFCLKFRSQSEISWARQFCRFVKKPVLIHEVHGENMVVKNAAEKEHFPIDYQCLRITPDGGTKTLRSSITDDSELVEEAHGDFYQSVEYVFNTLLQDSIDDLFDVESMDFYRPAQTKALSPRLEGIARELKCAKTIGFENMSGQLFLKIEAPDGSKRFARLNDDELSALREALGSLIPRAA